MSDEPPSMPNLSGAEGMLFGLLRGIRDQIADLKRQHETDKQEAIQARTERETRDDQKHLANVQRLDSMASKIDSVGTKADRSDEWISGIGKPLVLRVEAIENQGKEDAAESRGRKYAFGLIGAAIGTGFTVLTGMDGELVERIKRMLHLG